MACPNSSTAVCSRFRKLIDELKGDDLEPHRQKEILEQMQDVLKKTE